MAVTDNQFTINLLTGKYKQNNIYSMYTDAIINSRQKRLDIFNTCCEIRNGRPHVKIELKNLTLEQMEEKGLITLTPTVKKERVKVLEGESDYGDVIVAKKLLEKAGNAKARGLEFNLSFSDMKKLLKKKYCHYSGQRLSDIVGDANQRTLDRLDDKKGYVKGNVVACSHKFNQIKSRLFEDKSHDLYTTVKAMKKFLSKLEG